MSLSIRQLISQLDGGQIRIPAFQRGFVWEMDRVAYFIDSLYKRYPFGSFLFWRTRNQLTHERKLGPYELPNRDPDFPIDYVLDGQQRVTSVFHTFQTDLPRLPDPAWLDIYFDLKASGTAQDSQFVALTEMEADPERYFPMKTVFDATAYRHATSGYGDETIRIIDDLNSRFKELRLPVQYFETEDRAHVAIVFERVNRLGMELDTLQLLTAWTWSEDFDLQKRFEDLREELADYGFSDVGGDTNLIMRCAAAVLTSNPSAESLITLQGSDVRDQFPLVENGIRGAVDFLRTQLNVMTLQNLPYPALIVALCVFFAEPQGRQVSYDQSTYERLKQWFWSTCFSGRYTGQTIRAIRNDIEQMLKLKRGENSTLGAYPIKLGIEFFTGQQFRLSSANSKSFVLLLAQRRPLNFLSGSEISLNEVLQPYNRSEFHHLYPRKYLSDTETPDERANALGNFAFLSRAENNRIGGRRPSEYREMMPANFTEILSRAVCPDSLWNDAYEPFLIERAEMLLREALRLMGVTPILGYIEGTERLRGVQYDPVSGDMSITSSVSTTSGGDVVVVEEISSTPPTI